MDNNAFIETIINTLKFDSKYKDKQDTLLPIFRRSSINTIPKYAFAVRPGQHYENVEVRIPVPLLDNANALEKDILQLINYVYEEDEDYALGEIFIKPQIIYSTENENDEHDVIFSDIQDTIVQGIRDAKFLIWAAVAWFSNETIYKELLAKSKQGLNIRLIISEEDANQKLLPLLKGVFDVTILTRDGWNKYNRMHHKFCIIDLEYVMHGSYNWTETANYNKETLATATDKEFVKKFSDEFMSMYTKG